MRRPATCSLVSTTTTGRRVWARTAPFDPNLPIRGRYVRLRIEGQATGLAADANMVPVTLAVRDDALIIMPAPDQTGLSASSVTRDGVAALDQPLAYFIPEHVPDPSVRAQGEELWVEVTLPRRGPPRPIRLGVKKDRVLTPID